MTRKLSVASTFPVEPEVLYRAWLSSREHGAMTGSTARISARVGGRFSVWDGYITGTTLELDPPSRIVQSWRTGDFSDADADSRLEITFTRIRGGTRLTLTQTLVPEDQVESYRSGWRDWYFAPMREYFGG